MLNGSYFGTGMKGAEAQRIYAYIDSETGVLQGDSVDDTPGERIRNQRSYSKGAPA
jgi:hypothetical protein